jgi:hypothetical protein
MISLSAEGKVHIDFPLASSERVRVRDSSHLRSEIDA